jgi:predicted nucleotide-binding protein
MRKDQSAKLRQYRQELADIQPAHAKWGDIQTWIAKVSLFLRRVFSPEDCAAFEKLASPPKFAGAWSAGEPPTAHDSPVVRQKHRDLLAFLDTLIELSEPTPAETAPAETIGPLPFRPYKRGYGKIVGLIEQGDMVQLAAELDAVGGTSAVVAAIRKHLPTFDPAQAQEPNGPAWVQLKPILIVLGMTVDENTTLTDIMAFLNHKAPAGPPQPAPAEKDHSMPDPKRVFVIYGQNTDAYKHMLKFLRALKLNPISFSDLATECGSSPTIYDVVCHGMEEAAVVVAMFTPDECAWLRPAHNGGRRSGGDSPRWQARPNVIFEAGMAMARCREGTILVLLGGDVKLFSDLAGVLYVELNNSPRQRNLLESV